MHKKLSMFWSKGFIIGLVILLLNDHFLKAEFHNWFTGKLSDVAGLFIFPLFFAAFLPKYKKHIYWTIAIGFIWWKSPLANGFIDGLNVFTISRVIDWTDLLALVVLPISYYYFTNYKTNSVKLHPLPVMVLASFAFIATSRGREEVRINSTYYFNYSIDTLQKKVFFHPNIHNLFRKEWLFRDSMEHINPAFQRADSIKKKDDLFTAFLHPLQHVSIEDTSLCVNGFSAELEISGGKLGSTLYVRNLYHFCNDQRDKINPYLKKMFEEKVIKPLYE